MKKNNNSTFYRLPARYTLAFLAMAGSVSVAMADGKISMDGFSLNPGETITVPVKLNQTGDICSFLADFTFPKGITLVEAKSNSVSVVPGTHIFNYTPNYATNAETGESTARVMIFSMSQAPFHTVANEDAEFFYFTLSADGTFEGGDITVSDIELSNAAPVTFTPEDFTVSVAGPAKTNFSLASSEIVITEDGGPYVLELSLANTMTVRAMQGNLSLPEGVKIKKNKYGYAITYGDRLPQNTSFTYEESTGNFQLFAFSTDVWQGNSGKLFALELEFDESALTKTTEVLLGQFILTDADFESVNPEQKLKVTVDNSAYFTKKYGELFREIDAVVQEYENAKTVIEGYNSTVAAPYLSQLAEVKGLLDAERKRIEDLQTADTKPADVTLDLTAQSTAIAQVLMDAAEAQKTYEDNLAQYGKDQEAIAPVQEKWTDAQATLATYADEVQAQFAETAAELTDAVAALTTTAENSYKNGTSIADAEALRTAIEEAAAKIDTFLTAAAEAQKAYDDQMAKEANEAAYERLTAEIAEVQKALDKAKAEVAENAKDVADQFESDFDAIRKDIEALSVQVKELYDAVGLTENSSIANETGELFARIAETAERAKMAQTEYENQEAYKANEAQYVADREAIAAVTTQFEGVMRMISGYFEDVQTLVAEDIAEIEGLLEETSIMAEASHNAGTSVADAEALRNLLADIENKIEALSQKAAEAQTNHYIPGDADGDTVVDVNDFAKVKLHILESHLIEDVLRLKAADANGDGRIDVGDLTTIVDMILGPAQTAAPAAAPAVAVNDGLAIRVEGEGMHQRIGILLNAEQAYAACQMDIRLPEGVTLAQETTGEMAGELSLDSNDLENGIHRILLSSIEGASMNAGNGTLLWLDVNVDHTYNGENIVVSDVLFANAKGQTFAFAVNGGETTGLSNVSMTQEMKEKIYNAGGILMDGLKRGVNIIRGNDGSSKKVFVK